MPVAGWGGGAAAAAGVPQHLQQVAQQQQQVAQQQQQQVATQFEAVIAERDAAWQRLEEALSHLAVAETQRNDVVQQLQLTQQQLQTHSSSWPLCAQLPALMLRCWQKQQQHAFVCTRGSSCYPAMCAAQL
jgi:bisphosphoglycerate-independent phosphoglycerate mutase (AlkP superfamily)